MNAAINPAQTVPCVTIKNASIALRSNPFPKNMNSHSGFPNASTNPVPAEKKASALKVNIASMVYVTAIPTSVR